MKKYSYFLVLFIIVSCVSKSNYDKLENLNQELQEECNKLKIENTKLYKKVDKLDYDIITFKKNYENLEEENTELTKKMTYLQRINLN